MLSFDTLLIPVLGGFVFVKYSRLTRYKAIRDNGYVIFFKSAVFGLFFYGISFVLWRAIVLNEGVSPQIPGWLESLNFFLGHPNLVPALFTIILIGIATLISNYIFE